MIFPDECIPVLEREGMIHLLDIAILQQVCMRIRSSISNGETPIPVSVNLSRLDFRLCDIFTIADQIVSDYNIPHELIYFEITESVMAEEKAQFVRLFDPAAAPVRLRESGNISFSEVFRTNVRHGQYAWKE